MDRPTCSTCPYWDDDDPWGDEAVIEGECRRYPRFYPPSGSDHRTQEWPRTADYDWCGEHPDFLAYIRSLKPFEEWTTK